MTTEPKPDDGGPADEMSIRDYLAAHASSPTKKMYWKTAQKLMDTPLPHIDEKTGHCKRDLTSEETWEQIRWWDELEAKLRYVYADAMLAARNNP